jgi:quinohemoprotein ethanol dehydrogenase
VSIAVGWGGVYGIAARATERKGPGTVYTFAIGGKAAPPPFVEYKLNALLQGVPYDKTQYEAGTALYVSNCAFCHGVPGVDRGGNVPNLGYSSSETISALGKWLFNGPATKNGMPDFTGKLQPSDVPKLQAFIQGTADAIRPKSN